MIRRVLFVSLFFFGATSFSPAAENVPSVIKGITLFSNQALVNREAEVTVGRGVKEFILELEAFSVDKDSVSAKVFGEGEIQGVQYKEIRLKESPQENIRILEQKLRDLREAKRKILDEKEVLNKKELFLGSLINFSQAQVPKDVQTNFPKLDDLEKTLSFLGANFQSIYERKQSLDSKVQEVEKEIKLTEKELDSLRVPPQKTKKVIEVLFNSRREQTLKIEANYLVHQASWQPSYRVAVPLSLAEVDLVMFSAIRQKTGEDWKNVSLSLSNVIPSTGAGLPSLASWFLDIERPRAKSMLQERRVAPQKAEIAAPSEEPMMAPQQEREEADFVYAQKTELPLSFEYQIPQGVDIQSQDKETFLPIFSKKLRGEFFYYAVPRLNAVSFLVCRASADKELLSGPLNVFLAGRFIGKTFLREKKPGEPFDLSLGVDREVKIKREKIRDKIKETLWGMERKNVVRDVAFKITVENLKGKPLKMKILDSIPVSKTDKIEVRDVKITPLPNEKNYQDREGVLLWEFEIPAGKKEEINIEFVITHPKDLPVFGL